MSFVFRCSLRSTFRDPAKLLCRCSLRFSPKINTCHNCERHRPSSFYSRLLKLFINSCRFVIFVNQRVPFPLRLFSKNHRRFVPVYKTEVSPTLNGGKICSNFAPPSPGVIESRNHGHFLSCHGYMFVIC